MLSLVKARTFTPACLAMGATAWVSARRERPENDAISRSKARLCRAGGARGSAACVADIQCRRAAGGEGQLRRILQRLANRRQRPGEGHQQQHIAAGFANYCADGATAPGVREDGRPELPGICGA